jgi:hypothetical protein
MDEGPCSLFWGRGGDGITDLRIGEEFPAGWFLPFALEQLDGGRADGVGWDRVIRHGRGRRAEIWAEVVSVLCSLSESDGMKGWLWRDGDG